MILDQCLTLVGQKHDWTGHVAGRMRSAPDSSHACCWELCRRREGKEEVSLCGVLLELNVCLINCQHVGEM